MSLTLLVAKVSQKPRTGHTSLWSRCKSRQQPAELTPCSRSNSPRLLVVCFTLFSSGSALCSTVVRYQHSWWIINSWLIMGLGIRSTSWKLNVSHTIYCSRGLSESAIKADKFRRRLYYLTMKLSRRTTAQEFTQLCGQSWKTWFLERTGKDLNN